MMAEKEIVCRHKETIIGNRGECGICHQVRQYDNENPNNPPTIIKRGRINGVLTEVLPGGKYVEISSKSNIGTFPRRSEQPKEVTSPPKGELAQRTPDNWVTMNRVEKHQWLERHRKPITVDLETTGIPSTSQKWNLSRNTLYGLTRLWNVTVKIVKSGWRGRRKKETPSVIQEEAEQPTEDRAPANWEEMTKGEKIKWLVEHRKQITADMETIGVLDTAKKWHLPEGTLGGRARIWDVKVAKMEQQQRPPKKVETPPFKGPVTPIDMPRFPAFNEDWTEGVKIAWLEAYVKISLTDGSILPSSDKHTTPKARNVLDECLAHSLELFTKEYHNNLSDDRDRQDAFMETQCEFLEPVELTNQMSSWVHQLVAVGDNAFVRGVIYALNKTRDYFYSIKELEPESNHKT